MVASGLITRTDIPVQSTISSAALTLPMVMMRDKRQVEIKQAYALPRAGETLNYQLDVFLFMPRHMGVNGANYKAHDFYNDATVYLRLDAPGRTLRELSDLDDERSPLAKVHKTLPLLLGKRAPSTEPLAALCKLHAHELSESVISAFAGIARRARSGMVGRPDGFIHDVDLLLDDSRRALVALRQVRAELEAFGVLCHPELLRALGFAEEYVSAAIDEQVALLSEAVRDSESLRDGQGTGVRVLLVLARFALEEAKLRMESGYALPWDEPREYFTYRLGLLKKNLQQALYLNTRELKADNYLRNSAAMVAAGLAATWAFLAQMQTQNQAMMGSGTQMAVLGSAVGAYMLKDRIKEWSRDYLTRKLRLNDYSRGLVPDSFARLGLNGLVGRARERFRFLHVPDLEPEVRDIRTFHRSVMGTGLELEEVLHYRRRLTLRADDDAELPPGFGVREIFRFNVRALIARLDDPVDTISYYDANSARFTRDELPKVYHANLVLRISAEHSPQYWLTRSRLVLNQDGIVRVEPLMTRCQEGVVKD